MIKNKKIARYINEKTPRTAKEVTTYLRFFIENYDEFDAVLKEKDEYAFGNGLKKYEKLASHIIREHGLNWKGGGEIPPVIVRNLHKLARREKDEHRIKHRIPTRFQTVFRIYCPDD
jgi:hypothetical protein